MPEHSPSRKSTPSEQSRSTTVVEFSMEVNRDDLHRNDLPQPDQWEPADAARADELGLIYAFASSVKELRFTKGSRS